MYVHVLKLYMYMYVHVLKLYMYIQMVQTLQGGVRGEVFTGVQAGALSGSVWCVYCIALSDSAGGSYEDNHSYCSLHVHV